MQEEASSRERGTGGCSPGWGWGPGLLLQSSGSPLLEKEAVTGSHALPSTSSVHEGAVVALLGFGPPKGHQPAIAAGCSQCMQNRSGARHKQHQPCAWPMSLAGRTLGDTSLATCHGGVQQAGSEGLTEELRWVPSLLRSLSTKAGNGLAFIVGFFFP